METQPKYLGQPVTAPVTELDTIRAAPNLSRVVLRCDEVTALCPVTGQPDYYRVRIEFDPDKLCIESKSLKLYLWGFRDRGIFCEDLAGEICQAVWVAIAPNFCAASVTQNVRGGISIKAEATWIKRE